MAYIRVSRRLGFLPITFFDITNDKCKTLPFAPSRDEFRVQSAFMERGIISNKGQRAPETTLANCFLDYIEMRRLLRMCKTWAM